ncbi:MAG: hypothetical protein ABI665_06490 [Vicinamibacterales bacterium]
MRLVATFLCASLMLTAGLDAQARKPPAKKAPAKTAPAKTAPARKAAPVAPLARIQADLKCPSELGVGVATTRKFCDVLTSREPSEGILISIPPHKGPLTLSFELHNRHTYSPELIRTRQAYRKYTATIGVLTMDNTLVDRAVIQNEFRTEKDLFDRIAGGVGPGGMKAVAPTGDEFITIELPAEVEEQVSILGERLSVTRPDGVVDTFNASGRPIATISNVMLEYHPGPPPKKAAPKKP